MFYKVGDFQDLQGNFLIASPIMPDMLFRRSIIFINEVTEESSYGFCITNELGDKKKLEKAYKKLKGTVFDSSSIFFGGPVNTDYLFILHSGDVAVKSSLKVLNNLYVTVLDEALEKFDKKPNYYKILSGYCEWKPGQLESEVKQGYWLYESFNYKSLFDDQKDKWFKFYKHSDINYLKFSMESGTC